jgi:hypothetical protein
MTLSRTLFAIAVLVVLFSSAVYLIMNPERELRRLGRPTTPKHVRVIRMIGAGCFALFLLTLFKWVRG